VSWIAAPVMSSYIIIGAATAYWLAASNKDGSFGPLEAMIVIAVWPAVLGGIAVGAK